VSIVRDVVLVLLFASSVEKEVDNGFFFALFNLRFFFEFLIPFFGSF